MATRKQFMARCKELGVTVEDDGSSLVASAPKGKHFACRDLHMLSIDYDSPPGAWKKADAYQDLMDDLSYGLEDAPEDCDCRDEERQNEQ